MERVHAGTAGDGRPGGVKSRSTWTTTPRRRSTRGAVLAGLRVAPGGTPRVITQVTEHLAVLACCDALERWHGGRVTRLPVDSSGLVSPEAVADALARPARARGPAVASVM